MRGVVVNLHNRNWRTLLKAALDLAFGDAQSESVPASPPVRNAQ